MAKHIIFLVHGMGDAASGWSKPVQDLIKTRYSEYRQLNLLVPFDENFAFEEVLYNDKFDERRQAWKQNAAKVLEQLTPNGLDNTTVGLLTRYTEKIGADNFLATHVLDVILYRFFPPIAEQVRSAVQTKILGTLRAIPASDVLEWSIIAHSLGTSVIHDTLHAMYTQTPTDLLQATRPRVLMMVANVSRLLKTDADPYTSVVHPGVDRLDGVCDYFLNARNEWDPVPVPKQFRPVDDWPNLEARRQDRYQSLVINAIEDKDVHAFSHYLNNPKVHIPLFRALTWDSAIDQATAASAVARYEASTPLGKFDALIKNLKDVRIGEEADWEEVVQAFLDFRRLVV